MQCMLILTEYTSYCNILTVTEIVTISVQQFTSIVFYIIQQWRLWSNQLRDVLLDFLEALCCIITHMTLQITKHLYMQTFVQRRTIIRRTEQAITN